ncbi:MAG: hypothetical protein QXI89_01280 [Candidatus Anstonellales archaeon]
MASYIGFIGVVLILLGWIPETYSAIKEKRTINPAFALLYAIGSSMLAYHALLLNDMAFLILNVVASLIAFLNLYLSVSFKK